MIRGLFLVLIALFVFTPAFAHAHDDVFDSAGLDDEFAPDSLDAFDEAIQAASDAVDIPDVDMESFELPVRGSCITSLYGRRRLPRRGWHFHAGLDFRASQGTNVVAFTNGTVVDTGRYRACGRYVEIRTDNGYFAYYCHLSNYRKLKRGERVEAGQILGTSGTTGSAKHQPHLHLVIKTEPGFAPGTTVNPQAFFRSAKLCPGK